MSYLGGDALGGSEYFTGGDGSQCGCSGGIEGGGLFRDATNVLPLALSGNALAFWTSFVLVCILVLLLLIFMVGVDTSNGYFRLIAFIVILVGAGMVGHYEMYEGDMPLAQQTNYYDATRKNKVLSKYSP